MAPRRARREETSSLLLVELQQTARELSLGGAVGLAGVLVALGG